MGRREVEGERRDKRRLRRRGKKGRQGDGEEKRRDDRKG